MHSGFILCLIIIILIIFPENKELKKAKTGIFDIFRNNLYFKRVNSGNILKVLLISFTIDTKNSLSYTLCKSLKNYILFQV